MPGRVHRVQLLQVGRHTHRHRRGHRAQETVKIKRLTGAAAQPAATQ